MLHHIMHASCCLTLSLITLEIENIMHDIKCRKVVSSLLGNDLPVYPSFHLGTAAGGIFLMCDHGCGEEVSFGCSSDKSCLTFTSISGPSFHPCGTSRCPLLDCICPLLVFFLQVDTSNQCA